MISSARDTQRDGHSQGGAFLQETWYYVMLQHQKTQLLTLQEWATGDTPGEVMF